MTTTTKTSKHTPGRFDHKVVEEHIKADYKMGRNWHSPTGCACGHCRIARNARYATKHTSTGQSTPGPWKYEYGMVFDECGHGIAKADRDEDATSPTERDCNARLISLAWMLPELVEALTGILEIGKRDMSNPKYDSYFDAARTALARYHEQEESHG